MVEGKRRLAFPGGFGPVSYNGNLRGHAWEGDGVGWCEVGGHVERTEVERMPLGRFWAGWKVGRSEWEKENSRK